MMAKDKFHLKTLVIVQARMGSMRLPGKSMKEILGRPLLSFLIERLQRCAHHDRIIVATTNQPLDKQIVEFCRREHIHCYIGDENDVLDRYFQASLSEGADIVVRVTGDCPLIDPTIVDEVIRFFVDHYPKYDYVSNVIDRTYPRGMDVEVFSAKCLEAIKRYAVTPDEKEHVTAYVLNHRDRFSTYSIRSKKDLSDFRLTVDTEEDFLLIKTIIEELYPTNSLFAMKDILKVFRTHPEWKALNAHIRQKEGVSRK
ncbi:MAG: glycosyltransferase family protein [Chlamydiota bacterium]